MGEGNIANEGEVLVGGECILSLVMVTLLSVAFAGSPHDGPHRHLGNAA